ncbi:hypothetical protein HYH03_015143 [Edaphochlamys debaryana]|uniref:DNA (cytosine-5-)-methyltransferase n=1 Tax=Edaphochlamys debaryana TaxID=47281 RepID=A0A835XMI0_9CHLO|nr:hypothetical protein HYH03_015143 [Edaphochlamys debaryana]|eukprot:KAG2486180.1 hypothetical protein HYH03_015143 [Edaphochlamys debaryana]
MFGGRVLSGARPQARPAAPAGDGSGASRKRPSSRVARARAPEGPPAEQLPAAATAAAAAGSAASALAAGKGAAEAEPAGDEGHGKVPDFPSQLEVQCRDRSASPDLASAPRKRGALRMGIPVPHGGEGGKARRGDDGRWAETWMIICTCTACTADGAEGEAGGGARTDGSWGPAEGGGRLWRVLPGQLGRGRGQGQAAAPVSLEAHLKRLRLRLVHLPLPTSAGERLVHRVLLPAPPSPQQPRAVRVKGSGRARGSRLRGVSTSKASPGPAAPLLPAACTELVAFIWSAYFALRLGGAGQRPPGVAEAVALLLARSKQVASAVASAAVASAAKPTSAAVASAAEPTSSAVASAAEPTSAVASAAEPTSAVASAAEPAASAVASAAEPAADPASPSTSSTEPASPSGSVADTASPSAGSSPAPASGPAWLPLDPRPSSSPALALFGAAARGEGEELRPGSVVVLRPSVQAPDLGPTPWRKRSPHPPVVAEGEVALVMAVYGAAPEGGEGAEQELWVQLRRLVPGDATLLGDAADPAELFILDTALPPPAPHGAVGGLAGHLHGPKEAAYRCLPEHTLLAARLNPQQQQGQGQGGSKPKPKAKSKSKSKAGARQVALAPCGAPVVCAEVVGLLPAEPLTTRAAGHTARAPNHQADRQRREDNTDRHRNGLPPRLFYRLTYAPRQAAFRNPLPEELPTGVPVPPPGQRPPGPAWRLLPGGPGEGLELDGVEYRVGDLLWLAPQPAPLPSTSESLPGKDSAGGVWARARLLEVLPPGGAEAEGAEAGAEPAFAGKGNNDESYACPTLRVRPLSAPAFGAEEAGEDEDEGGEEEESGAACTRWAVELDPEAAAAFSANFPSVGLFVRDCTHLLLAAMTRAGVQASCVASPEAQKGAREIPPELAARLPAPGEVELLAGGPPCPGFSRLNEGRGITADAMSQNAMVLAFLSYLDFYRPRFFLLENVVGFLQPFKEDEEAGGEAGGSDREGGSEDKSRSASDREGGSGGGSEVEAGSSGGGGSEDGAEGGSVSESEGTDGPEPDTAAEAEEESSTEPGAENELRTEAGEELRAGTDKVGVAGADAEEAKAEAEAEAEASQGAGPSSSSEPSPSAAPAKASRARKSPKAPKPPPKPLNYYARLTLASLLAMGYQARIGALNASHYGVPQVRQRAFVWAAAPGEALPGWPAPRTAAPACPTGLDLPGGKYVASAHPGRCHGAPAPTVTIREAIADLPPLKGGSDRGAPVMPHTMPPHSPFAAAMRQPRTAAADTAAGPGPELCSPGAQGAPAQGAHGPAAGGSGADDEAASRTGAQGDESGATAGTGAWLLLRDHVLMPPSKLPWKGEAPAGLEDITPEERERRMLAGIPNGRDWTALLGTPLEPLLDPTWAGKAAAKRAVGKKYGENLLSRRSYRGLLPTATTGAQPEARGSRGWVHPDAEGGQHRMLSVRERARGQGFSDAHVFTGPPDARIRQVGNAVPPPLAAALGEQLRRAAAGGAKKAAGQQQAPTPPTAPPAGPAAGPHGAASP